MYVGVMGKESCVRCGPSGYMCIRLIVLWMYLGYIRHIHTQTITTTFKLVIGVFSPRDTGWEESVQLAWRQLEHPDLELVFFYYRELYDVTLQDARTVEANLVSKSISAILGPYHPLLELVADDKRIPYVTTSLPPEHIRTERHHGFCYHIIPSVSVLNDVMLGIMDKYDWDQSAVLYNKPEGLQLVAEMMTKRNFEVSAFRIEDGSNSSELLDHLLAARIQAIQTFAVVCDADTLKNVLDVALRLSMMSTRYHWLVLSMDSHTIDYEQYAYTQVNFTIFQLYTESFLGKLNVSMDGTDVSTLLRASDIGVIQYAVSLDSLALFIRAAQSLKGNATSCPPYCSTTHVIEGYDLDNYIKNITLEGETGLIRFDEQNYRRSVLLYVMSLEEQGLIQLGTWQQEPEEPGSQLNLLPYINKERKEPNILGQQKVRIVTIIDPPFVMYDEKNRDSKQNDRFKGYLVDLIGEIARQLKFEFDLYESPDGNYGARNPLTNEWNGMIRELIDGKAAMCLGAISITSEREQAVDFTKPYKQKKFNFLMKKPERKKSIFQFLWPLSTYVWLLTVSSMVIVGFLLFLMDHFSPNSDHKHVGRFTLKESIWFIYGSLVGVGTELVPRTISGRLLSGAWWFFGLILVSSYTANLAAFLTVTKIETPIKSVADLARQTKIKYGTVKNTYANSMFRTSEIDLFKKMWTSMDKVHPDAMVDNFSVGVDKVKSEDYAFIWDTPINDYIALHDCETISVGDPFDEKGYGIGVPFGASYRDQITLVILSLGEEGFMTTLEDRWWSGGKCEEFKETSTSGTKELQIDNVAGVFVVVAMGALLGLIACFFECLWIMMRKKRKKTPAEDGTMDRDGSSVTLRNSLLVNNYSQEFAHTPRKESRL